MNEEHHKKMAEVLHHEENFEVKRLGTVAHNYTALWVYYPDCPCPNKIMVYRKCPDTDGSERIMPHFGMPDSPIARF